MQINCSTRISIFPSVNLEARSFLNQPLKFKLNKDDFEHTMVEMSFKFVIAGLLGQLLLFSCVTLFLVFLYYFLCGQRGEEETHTEVEMNSLGSWPGPVRPGPQNPGLGRPQNSQQRNVTFQTTE